MDQAKRPIHTLFAGEATIRSVQKKEGGSKNGKSWGPKISVEFEASDGRWIEGKFRLPFTDPKHKYDEKNFKALLAIAGVKTPSELNGHVVGIIVTPFEWNGKVLWNPQGYYHAKYLKDPMEAALGELDDLMGEDSSENIPF